VSGFTYSKSERDAQRSSGSEETASDGTEIGKISPQPLMVAGLSLTSTLEGHLVVLQQQLR
jgi:hypothetical protein